jgi:hypothetical protein
MKIFDLSAGEVLSSPTYRPWAFAWQECKHFRCTKARAKLIGTRGGALSVSEVHRGVFCSARRASRVAAKVMESVRCYESECLRTCVPGKAAPDEECAHAGSTGGDCTAGHTLICCRAPIKKEHSGAEAAKISAFALLSVAWRTLCSNSAMSLSCMLSAEPNNVPRHLKSRCPAQVGRNSARPHRWTSGRRGCPRRAAQGRGLRGDTTCISYTWKMMINKAHPRSANAIY